VRRRSFAKVGARVVRFAVNRSCVRSTEELVGALKPGIQPCRCALREARAEVCSWLPVRARGPAVRTCLHVQPGRERIPSALRPSGLPDVHQRLWRADPPTTGHMAIVWSRLPHLQWNAPIQDTLGALVELLALERAMEPNTAKVAAPLPHTAAIQEQLDRRPLCASAPARGRCRSEPAGPPSGRWTDRPRRRRPARDFYRTRRVAPETSA